MNSPKPPATSISVADRTRPGAVPADVHPERPGAPADCGHYAARRRNGAGMSHRLLLAKICQRLMLTLTGVCALRRRVGPVFHSRLSGLSRRQRPSTGISSPSCRRPSAKPAAAWPTPSWAAPSCCFSAAVFGVPIGLLGGCLPRGVRRRARLPFVVRYTADLLNGVPSIVIGIFAYTPGRAAGEAFLDAGWRFRARLMMIPITCAAPKNFCAPCRVPCAKAPWRWAPASGGRSPRSWCRRRIARHHDRHAACPSRASREKPLRCSSPPSATVSGVPAGSQPIASLPVMIFTYAIAPYDDWHRQAWAAGLVLLGLILVINIVARVILSPGVAVPRT